MLNPKDPTKMLETVLRLIDQDIKRVKKAARQGKQLDPRTAKTLCDYAKCIAAIKEEKDAEDLKTKRRLERMSTDELIKAYQDRSKKGTT